MGFFDKFSSILGRGKTKTSDTLDHYLGLAKRDPGDAKAHLKLAEIYQKNGDKAKAISEYLVAADIFSKNNFFAQAMAIYKQVPRQDPTIDHVYIKIADIYRKMGFLGDAGMKARALETMALMAELDPRKTELKEKVKDIEEGLLRQLEGEAKALRIVTPESGKEPKGVKKLEAFFDLGAELEKMESVDLKGVPEIETLDKIFGFEEIFRELKENSGPSNVDPNFNYNMGVACREMGFFEDAVEQFNMAIATGQNAFEAANLLGLLYKGRKMYEEARQVFDKALKMKVELKYELGLLFKEMGKAEEAIKLLKDISADQIQKLTGSKELRAGNPIK
ncbi:MAG: tetratricopeptide repeat protein [Deltaproteobacteria bacterium]|nr:tetratricopeptide repeat protein [Deltaproteobacteria bacterium]